MAKSSPLKVSVDCPHCGFKQQEYAAAKTTLCRQCGAHFSPSTPRKTPSVGGGRQSEPRQVFSAGSSLKERLGSFWKSKRTRVVECFDCKRKQEVSAAATSTICPGCSAHIDLNDYKISTSFSRSIRTTGAVHITSKGDLNSSTVHCGRAVIEGRLRGNLHCTGLAKIVASGKIPGRLSAHEVVVEKRANVQFFRRVRVDNIEIRGKMSGEIIAQGTVTIRKHGLLEGSVTAKAINVEKRGVFTGQLIIGKADLQQGELLPPEAQTAGGKSGTVRLARPLPVT